MIPSLLGAASAGDGLWRSLFTGIFSYFFSIAAFLLALILVARLIKERRKPGTTISWLVVLILIPHIGVPIYLLFGGRKLRKLAAAKDQLTPRKDPRELLYLEGWAKEHPLFYAASNPPTSGNKLKFLLTGQQTFAIFEQEIKNAESSIDIMAFILANDETGRLFIDLLTQKANEGVTVRLLLDSLGCFKIREPFIRKLRNAGGKIARFMPVLPIQARWSANLRNHRKMAIFDNRTAIVGGHNIATEYLGPRPCSKRFQDFGARITGPAVDELSEIFQADWNFATGEPPESPKPPPTPKLSAPNRGLLQVIASGPDVPQDTLYEAILLLIGEARKHVTIITPYFIPDEVLFRSLILKLRSRRQVTIIVPRKSNHPITDYARAHYLRELQRAGARVLAYVPGMLHAKVILVDRKVVMFGSVNIDLRSLFVNYEVGLFCYSKPEVEKVAEWAETIAARSILFESDRKRPPGFLKTIGEDLSRLVAPLI